MYALFSSLVLALSLAAAPAQAAQAKQQPAKHAKKVWTNDDLEALRGGPVSTAAAQAPATTQAAPEQPKEAEKKSLPPEKDPKAYLEKLVPLRQKLADLDAQIKQVQDALNNPFNGTNAVDMRHSSAEKRPEDLLKELQQQRQDAQQKIDALEEQARRNGIAPGDIR